MAAIDRAIQALIPAPVALRICPIAFDLLASVFHEMLCLVFDQLTFRFAHPSHATLVRFILSIPREQEDLLKLLNEPVLDGDVYVMGGFVGNTCHQVLVSYCWSDRQLII